MTDAAGANVHNLPVPNIEIMREHLEHMFGGYLDGLHEGLIELAWTDTRPTSDGRYALRHARQFGTHEIEELVQEACRLNAQEQCNVYIGAALRKPDTFPGGRAKDLDFLGLTCAYVDLDDPGVADVAKAHYQSAKPTKVVVTGREPHLRAQLWWRLTEPIIDPALSEALLKGMASILSGDSSVTNPARVMRLAGSIAWPVKPHRQIEQTYTVALKEPGAPAYSFEYLSKIFSPIHAAHTDGLHVPDEEGVSRERDSFGFAGKVNDGRDLYLLKTVEAVLIQLIGETGRCPTPQELINAVWPQYSRNADLTKAGKGAEEVKKKCLYTIKRFNEGKIKGCRNLAEAQEIYRRKQAWRSKEEWTKKDNKYQNFDDEFNEQAAKAPTGRALMEVLDVRQIKAQADPVYLIDGLINEHSLGFIFGPPGSLKTFIALDIALSIATTQATWWGRKVTQHGAVIYLCREGVSSLKFRIMAWEQHRGAIADDAPFFLIKQPMSFMKGEDVELLQATVEDVVARIKVPVTAIFVDTVSRVLPGAKENQQEDMSLFVWACELLQNKFKCIVAGVHHTNRNGTIRGSSVIPGAGDFLIETRREERQMTGSLFVEKVKDGADGYEIPFKATKIDGLGTIVPHSSLVVDPNGDAKPAAAPGAGGDGLPDMMVCREILSALALAWFNKVPWNSADNSARPAVRLIMARWTLKREPVKRLLAGWMANGIIEHTVCDAKNRISGYRKIIDL